MPRNVECDFVMESDDESAYGKKATANSMVIKKQKMVSWGRWVLVGACLIGLGLSLANAQPPEKKKTDTKKKLTGAELYAINCNRCHPERYATEFTSAQWKTIMMHMRVRANLPAAQAKVILKYLQEDSGN
jgi:mono/diheme cytochrome c family protein